MGSARGGSSNSSSSSSTSSNSRSSSNMLQRVATTGREAGSVDNTNEAAATTLNGETSLTYRGDYSSRFPAVLAVACSGALAFAVTAQAALLAWRSRYVRQGPALLTDAAPV